MVLSAALLGDGVVDEVEKKRSPGAKGSSDDVRVEMERLNPNDGAESKMKPPPIDSFPASSSPPSSFSDSLKNTLGFLLRPDLAPLLFIKVAGGVTSSAYSTAVPLVLMEGIGGSSGGDGGSETGGGMSPAELGRIMSAGMMTAAVFGAIGIGPAMKLAGSRGGRAVDRLAAAGLILRSLAVIGFAAIVASSPSILRASAISVVVSLASHAHATSLTSLTTGLVAVNERGALLGLEHGLFSMARIVGPTLGTWLLSSSSFGGVLFGGKGGVWALVLACAAADLCLAAMLVWVRARQRRRCDDGRGKVKVGTGDLWASEDDTKSHSD